MKAVFRKTPPKRSGNYVVKDDRGEAAIVTLYYCKEGREWWVATYPEAGSYHPIDGKSAAWIDRWGPRV